MSNKVVPLEFNSDEYIKQKYPKRFLQSDFDHAHQANPVPEYSRGFSVNDSEYIRSDQYWSRPIQEGIDYDQIEPEVKTTKDNAETSKDNTGDSKKVLRTFVETSSVKGLPKVFKSPSKFQKALWAVCLLIGLVIGALQLWLLFSQYLAFATVVTTVEVNDSPTFPDISICNLNPIPTDLPISLTYDDYINNVANYGFPLVFDNVSDIDQANLVGIQHYMFVHQYTSEGYFQNIPREDDENLEFQKYFFILDCAWQPWDNVANSDSINCRNVFETHIEYFYSHHYGPCFTLQIPSTKRAKDISTFSIILYLEDRRFETMYDFTLSSDWSFASGARVKVHPRGTLPNMARAVTASPGHETTIWVEQMERTRLDKPWGECYGGKHLPMDDNYEYEIDACRSLCIQQKVIDDCACVTNKELLTMSMRQEHLFCGHMNYTDYDWTYDRVLCAQQALAKVASCGCKQACKETRNSIQVTQAPWPHESHYFWFYARFIYPFVWDRERFAEFDYMEYATSYNDLELFNLDLIKRNFLQVNINMKEFGYNVVSTTEKMPFVNLTGALGGILNLWIGITFVTFIEVCDLVYQLIMSNVVGRKKSNTDSEVKHNSSQ